MELEFIRWLREQVRNRPSVDVAVGIGDDAAVLSLPAGESAVVTTDMLMDGVDFELRSVDPVRVGRKALAVNLSDLAAMAARPVAAFVSVALPRSGGLVLARQLYSGLLALADEFQVALAGGDTNSWDGPLVIDVTAIGAVGSRGPLLRSGAKPGDEILVTGELGGSILGRHFDFVPRVKEARWLHDQFALHAGIDISDGLALDVSRLAQESKCGAVLDLSEIPISPAAHQLAQQSGDKRSPLEHALGDGEDFELVLAISSEEALRILQAPDLPVPIRRIGQFTSEQGLWSIDSNGRRTLLPPHGFEHRLT